MPLAAQFHALATLLLQHSLRVVLRIEACPVMGERGGVGCACMEHVPGCSKQLGLAPGPQTAAVAWPGHVGLSGPVGPQVCDWLHHSQGPACVGGAGEVWAVLRVTGCCWWLCC
jgi:hypothetical protein